MLIIERTKQFKKDYKKVTKRSDGEKIKSELMHILKLLIKKEPLPSKNRDYGLTGQLKGFRDCHLKPDVILIYKVNKKLLQLLRMAWHSELGI